MRIRQSIAMSQTLIQPDSSRIFAVICRRRILVLPSGKAISKWLTYT